MEEQFPQALLSTPGMVTVLVVVILAEILSLAFLWLTSYEYKQLRRRHATFFRAIGGNDIHAKKERTSRIIFIVYVVSSIVITGITLALFLFQPHLI